MIRFKKTILNSKIKKEFKLNDLALLIDLANKKRDKEPLLIQKSKEILK